MAGISAADQNYLNVYDFGLEEALSVGLGTLIKNAESGTTSPLNSGLIFVGSALNFAAPVAMSGDATIVASGALTIAAGAVTNAKVSASAGIAYSKLAALTSGNILVGSAGNVATAVAMSGDATIVASGALTIGAGAVTKAKLAAGVQPAFMVVFAGKTVMAGTTQDITVTGAVAGDICVAQINTLDANSRTIVTSITATDKITVVYSGAAGAGGSVSWAVLRATS